ncbi:hypothetical protein O3P69_013387 [Scylla paramamosain]|uniref:Uncharacterized protein n=1 Tax=Scylla paramamosain TaxID=85552 RepID=A0AAW0U4N0_SCYPA
MSRACSVLKYERHALLAYSSYLFSAGNIFLEVLQCVRATAFVLLFSVHTTGAESGTMDVTDDLGAGTAQTLLAALAAMKSQQQERQDMLCHAVQDIQFQLTGWKEELKEFTLKSCLEFELLAEAQAWDSKEQAMQQVSSLKGTAIEVLSQLMLQQRISYHCMVAALEQRDQFVDALGNPRLQVYVKQSQATDLQEVLAQTLELKSFVASNATMQLEVGRRQKFQQGPLPARDPEAPPSLRYQSTALQAVQVEGTVNGEPHFLTMSVNGERLPLLEYHKMEVIMLVANATVEEQHISKGNVVGSCEVERVRTATSTKQWMQCTGDSVLAHL